MNGDVASTAVDASAEHRAATRAKPGWSLLGSLAAVKRFLEAAAGHVRDGEALLAELAALEEVRVSATEIVDVAARHLLDHHDYSYREIGMALKISPQAVAKRYPSSGTRRPGGQPGNLR